MDSHQLANLPIINTGRIAKSQRGEISVILYQYPYVPSGNTIQYCLQLEVFKNTIDDKLIHAASGKQHLFTNEGYVTPYREMAYYKCSYAISQTQNWVILHT